MGRSCYAPSPPRDSRRRGLNPSPRGRYGGGQGRDLPNCLLVSNIRYQCRYSRSSAPRHARSRPRSYDYASPHRSVSPYDRRDSRERSYRRRDSPGRSYSRSPQFNGSRSRHQRPARGRSLSRSRRRSRSISRSRNPRRSPRNGEEFRSEANGEWRR